MVKVLKASYLQNLRDEAVKAYKEQLSIKLGQKRDAMGIIESEVAVFGKHAPTDSSQFENWFSELKRKNEEARLARLAYEALVEETKDDETIYQSNQFGWFINRYEEKHYNPQEEDYEEVKVPDEESHASETEAVGGMIIGEN